MLSGGLWSGRRGKISTDLRVETHRHQDLDCASHHHLGASASIWVSESAKVAFFQLLKSV